MGDYRTTSGEKPPKTIHELRHQRKMAVIWGLLLIVAIVLAGWLIKVRRYALAYGYVASYPYAEVRPPVTGIVDEIHVFSGDRVEQGDLLVTLNAREEEALLAEAEAKVLRLKAEIARRKIEQENDLERRRVDLDEQKRIYASELDVAQKKYDYERGKLETTRSLVEEGLKAASSLEDAEMATNLAEAELNLLKNRNFNSYEQLLARDAEKYSQEREAMQNELDAVEESVRRIQAQLETREIRAPISGTVVRYEFVPGELLQTSSVIYEIFGDKNQQLKLRVDERYAAKVAPGNDYRAQLSSYRGINKIYFWGNVMNMRDVIQTEGNKTYRVAYCSFEPGDRVIPPGTTAEARIYYGSSAFWFYLFNIE